MKYQFYFNVSTRPDLFSAILEYRRCDRMKQWYCKRQLQLKNTFIIMAITYG